VPGSLARALDAKHLWRDRGTVKAGDLMSTLVRGTATPNKVGEL
jgi:hypothetical protein